MERSWTTCVLPLLVLALVMPSLQIEDLGRRNGSSSEIEYGYAEAHRKLQAISVTVGYTAQAPFKVPRGGDALPAFKAAADKLKSNGGGTIKIQAGVYTLSYQWDIKSSDTTVQGAGIDATTLKLANGASRFSQAGFIRFRGFKNVVFRDFTIDGNKVNQKKTTASAMLQSSITYGRYCFYADGFTNLKFRRVRTQNCQGYGFDPHGIKYNPLIWSRGIDIQFCEAVNNGWDGFTIDQIIGGTIANNVARGNGRHGFNVVTGARGITLFGNKAENNGFGKGEKAGGGCGYVAGNNFNLGTRDITIRDNTAKGNNKAGSCVLGSANVQITGNTFSGSPYCGHWSGAGVTKNLFANNKCINTPKGVFIGQGANKNQVKITGNTGL